MNLGFPSVVSAVDLICNMSATSYLLPVVEHANIRLFSSHNMPLPPEDEEARYAARYRALNERISVLVEENQELKEDKRSFRTSSNQYQSELLRAKDKIEKLRHRLKLKEEENMELKATVTRLQV